MTTARAETSEQRLSIYRGLVARNRLISLLRLALPVAGLAAFGWFAVHILLASLGGAFSIGSISFSGGSVIVDTPSYSGIMANGNVYKVSAEAALNGGRADAAVFGSSFLANPDLLERFWADSPLNTPDKSTFYSPGARGYTDYPTLHATENT